MRRVLLMLMLLLLCGPGRVMAAEPRAFVPGSYDAIVQHYREQPFLLVLWSVDCAPCRSELAVLGEMVRSHPDVPLVLVATDGMEAVGEVRDILAGNGLQHVEAWVFAHEPVERLRFEIDRAWRGELPRNYLYDAAHKRSAVSGRLDHATLEAWLQAVALMVKTP